MGALLVVEGEEQSFQVETAKVVLSIVEGHCWEVMRFAIIELFLVRLLWRAGLLVVPHRDRMFGINYFLILRYRHILERCTKKALNRSELGY